MPVARGVLVVVIASVGAELELYLLDDCAREAKKEVDRNRG